MMATAMLKLMTVMYIFSTFMVFMLVSRRYIRKGATKL